MENKDKVLKAMQDKAAPMRTGEIVEATGLEKKEVEKAMKALKTTEEIYSPKRCFWQAK
jgi:DNA replicative helicase MCM subunit Mcm2 (Cdc46/Mcm family)